jgi:uncharacterized protein DUF6137
MSPSFVRQLVIRTICEVNGEDVDEVLARNPFQADTRDWEQMIGRLEAIFDLTLHRFTAATRTIDIDELAEIIHANSADLIS